MLFSVHIQLGDSFQERISQRSEQMTAQVLQLTFTDHGSWDCIVKLSVFSYTINLFTHDKSQFAS